MIPDLFPRERYYCVLDEQPDFLVPQSALEARSDHHASDQLIVNPRVWLGWHGSLPPAAAALTGSGEGLFDFPWTIWVDDVECGALWPYWLGPDYAWLLESLVPGEPCPAGIPQEVVSTLRQAEILIAPDAAARERIAWLTAIESWTALLAYGYVPLSGLLPPYHLGALRRYYRYHTRIGTFTLGDDQTSRRFVAYDEPVTMYFHRQLACVISAVARRVLVPSYSYLAFYQGGATLESHTDREACQYTVSLCIDATPDPLTYGAWPLNLMTGAGPVSVTQGVGDALLFLGRDIPHWRDRLPEGYTASSVLFHFVEAEAL